MTTKMIRNSRGLRYLVVAMVAMLLIAPATAVAVPSPPHEVFGTVTDQNENAVDGLTVTVTDEDGNSYTATTDADGYYEIKFPAEDGSEGETLTVSVEGKDASDTTSFESATSERIDLSVEVDTGGGGNTGGGGDTGGGGGGGGGAAPPEDTATPGGDTTPEPVSETVDLDQDGAAQVQLSGGTGATSVSVSVPDATGQTSVQELPEPPADVPAPEGDYVSGVDISAPDPSEGESATVSISISQSRLDELGVSAEQLVIQHYRDGAWETLETSAETQDGEVVLSAETTGFSPFAVTTQEQAQVTTTADVTTQPDETTEPATQATTTSPPGDDGGPGPLLIAGVVIVILAIVAGAYFASQNE